MIFGLGNCYASLPLFIMLNKLTLRKYNKGIYSGKIAVYLYDGDAKKNYLMARLNNVEEAISYVLQYVKDHDIEIPFKLNVQL